MPWYEIGVGALAVAGWFWKSRQAKRVALDLVQLIPNRTIERLTGVFDAASDPDPRNWKRTQELAKQYRREAKAMRR